MTQAIGMGPYTRTDRSENENDEVSTNNGRCVAIRRIRGTERELEDGVMFVCFNSGSTGYIIKVDGFQLLANGGATPEIRPCESAPRVPAL